MKLESYGIHGNLFSWMKSFLTKRVQAVIFEGATSPPSPVTSSVPQGSVLGSLLFLTYINDLPNGLTSTVKLFADDTLLYGVVVDVSDCDNLQDDLNKLEIWQPEWQIQFILQSATSSASQISKDLLNGHTFSVDPNLNK